MLNRSLASAASRGYELSNEDCRHAPGTRPRPIRAEKEAADHDASPYVYLHRLDSLGVKDGDPLQISAQRRWLRGLRGPTGV